MIRQAVGEQIRVYSLVSLVRTNDARDEIVDSISEALDLINFRMDFSERSVVIKPNLCYYWDAATGQTTDPRVVSGIIDFVRERYGMDVEIKIVEADATAMRTKYAFPLLGYEKMAKRKNVELFNLSGDKIVAKKVTVNRKELVFKIPESLLKANLFINVPKLKITPMKNLYITCAFKNIFGCIAARRKILYHGFLNEAIVGMNKILHPNVTVVDGIFALGRLPVKLDLIMAGCNPFSIDWICSQIMGYNPAKIEFLKLAIKEGLGNPKDIVMYGEDSNTFKRIFPKKNMKISKLSMNMQMKILKLYTKLAGDVTHPILEGI